MKYIFIAGLEHSGSTLTDFLLSQSPNALGLGEVWQFFDPKHMHQYMQTWGSYKDVDFCSCMNPWRECLFWQDLISINGLNSTLPIDEKYLYLLNYVDTNYGAKTTVIDSSKSLTAFLQIEKTLEQSKIISSKKIIFTCKDVRSFAMSIFRKNKKTSLIEIYKTFNWWVSVNNSWLGFLEESSYDYVINLYENLCESPYKLVKYITNNAYDERAVGSSHIAMGNKNFALRNKHHITYDDAWRSNWKIKLVYFFHFKARKLNARLYRIALK